MIFSLTSLKVFLWYTPVVAHTCMYISTMALEANTTGLNFYLQIDLQTEAKSGNRHTQFSLIVTMAARKDIAHSCSLKLCKLWIFISGTKAGFRKNDRDQKMHKWPLRQLSHPKIHTLLMSKRKVVFLGTLCLVQTEII